MLVIQRSGTAVATELALREISGEVASLRRMRIDPQDYLVVPRVVGMAVSNAALTLYVQLIAVGGGMVLAALVINVPLAEMLNYFFVLASPLDLVLAPEKPALRRRNRRDLLLRAAPRQSLDQRRPAGRDPRGHRGAACRDASECDFAYLVYGVAFFGL